MSYKDTVLQILEQLEANETKETGGVYKTLPDAERGRTTHSPPDQGSSVWLYRKEVMTL